MVLWNLFYHLYISQNQLIVLQSHAAELVLRSESIESWSLSSYGKAVNFLSKNTLLEVRRFWSLYAENQRLSTVDADAFRKAVATARPERYGPGHLVIHGIRSTGARGIYANSAMSGAFYGYWKTGVTAGNRKDLAALGFDRKGRVNPMFAFSSSPNRAFSVHYRSDPLLGFHLAEVFDSGHSDSNKANELTNAAKSQF